LPVTVLGWENSMKSRVFKRSVVVAGHKTSVSLEDEFWNALREIAHDRHTRLSELVASIDAGRSHGNLSSAIRLFVLGHFRDELKSISGAHDGVAPEIGQPLTGSVSLR